MAEPIQKRQIAYKVGINSLVKGEYVKESGWLPNYILINGQKASRVNVIGVIVNIAEGTSSKEFLLEDKTGRMAVRSFENLEVLSKLNVGEIVKIIGRPREFNNEKYLVPEIVKVVDRGWFELRVLELGEVVSEKPEEIKIEKEKIKENIIKSNVDPEEVIKIIKLLDSGDGADYEEVVSKIKDDKIIKALLEEGEIFEIKPGRLKIL